jgi:rod shape-determining protein MreC
VYDRKTVRRRRAVLGLLVACSLILLTAYFGEGAGGGLHAVQRGAAEVLTPVERVGSGALKPFRDLFGWVGDTFHAKGDNKDLRREVEQLRAQNVTLADQAAQGEQLRKLFELDQESGLDPRRQVTAAVVVHSPTLWYSTININKGTGAGVRVHDPVVNGDGLVGSVTHVWGNGAQVTLLTDRESGVAAKLVGTSGRNLVTGTVTTGTPGNPNDLLMTFIEPGKRVVRGQRLETSGISSSRFPSLFPAGIPIGRVTKVDDDELRTSQQVHIRAYANLRNLDYVQVVTQPQA